MDETIAKVADWAAASRVKPLAAGLVPGTTRSERRSLAALGGVALALGRRRAKWWPEPVRLWAEQGPPPPDRLLRAIRRDLSSGDDVLGALYERVVSGTSRRRLGTYFTPPAVVDFMLRRVEAAMGPPGAVIDPGAGVGAFTVAARRRWPSARVVAVDVNVVTLGLLAARSAAERVDRVELVLADFLKWLNSIDRLPGPNVILGNPPYTRHQELPVNIKRQAKRHVGDLVDSSLAGLSAYFLAASLRALDDQDGLCLLLPGTWVDARYGRPLREALWKKTGRPVEFSTFPTDVQLFPGTRVTAVALTVGPVRANRQPLVAHSLTVDAARVRVVRIRKRARTGKLPERFGPWLWSGTRVRTLDRVLLGDFAHVRRGVATGGNSFFFLTDEERAVLPEGVALPALRSIRHVPGELLDREAHKAIGNRGEPRWLLWLEDQELLANPSVSALIALGEKAGLHLRYLTSLRDPWYLVEKVTPPDLMIGPMGKKRLRAVENEVGAIPSNSMYGIYLKEDGYLGAGLTRWLNTADGQRALRANARRYSDGLFKLEPRDLLTVRVPKSEFLSDLGESGSLPP